MAKYYSRQEPIKSVEDNLFSKFNMFSFNSITVTIVTVLIFGYFVLLTQSSIGLTFLGYKMVMLERFIKFVVDIKELPLLVIAVPLIGGLVELLGGRKSDNVRDIVVVYTTFITLILVLAMYPHALDGTLTYSLDKLLGFGFTFKVDMLSLTLAMTTSILWLPVMIYSHKYMLQENHRNRFYFFMAVTFSSILGTVLAGDLFTMFMFFELMTFSSYMLVSHGESKESLKAGYSYLFIGVIGGLAILLGMILLSVYTGNLSFVPMADKLVNMGNMRYLIFGLIMFGFAIKAGMAPVHVWLPKAHPVAPTPASALLSGIMIKIGAYGILRVATTYLFPASFQITDYKDVLWSVSKSFGSGLIWMGIITMAIGVFMALQQSNIKRMLAYHSVSQMGYIVLGIGVAVYLGYKGAMGYSGAMYHIINHALFKSLLFMVAGVVYMYTHELDMYKLGGLWKRLPFTALICLIAVFGITGMPGFNGFISKSILHHAIIEAYQYGAPSFRGAEIIFNIISAGTVCSFLKLFGFVFLGKEKGAHYTKQTFKTMEMAMAGIAVMIIAIGLRPDYLLNTFILPAVRAVTYDPAFIDKYVVGLKYFTTSALTEMAGIYALGIVMFIAGVKFHLFHLHFPQWMSIEYLVFYPVNKVLQWYCYLLGNCKTDADVITKSSGFVNPFSEERSLDHPKPLSFMNRLVMTADLFTSRYENALIRGDVLIYTVIVTVALIALIIFA
jgi:formate hydrogenlyase subunit 3/multisubunit Na+/H+ antiporter MnhD subunit